MIQIKRSVVSVLFLLIVGSVLAACKGSEESSGGGNSNKPGPSVAAPNFYYLVNDAVLSKNLVIADAIPLNSGGAIASCVASPTLPIGLSLSSACVISGKPTAVVAQANYKITGSNSGGSASATVSFKVNDLLPVISFSTSSVTAIKGLSFPVFTPSLSGGAISSCSVSPTLPLGMSYSNTDCSIFGTPTQVKAGQTYTVTATNSGGPYSTTIFLAVNDSQPTGLSYSQMTASYTKGVAIANNVPTVTSGGAVTSYTVSPILPLGLTLIGSTGVISGTPTAVTAAKTYVVTGTNSGGSVTASLNIVVNDVAPSNLSYTTPLVYTKGTAITNNVPTVSGGTVVKYTVSPGLPLGLSIGETSGVISGTPTTVTGLGSYTVTATNSGGSATKVISIRVQDQAPTALTYNLTTFSLTKGIDNGYFTPSNQGGAITNYTFPSPVPSPGPLPAGMSLNQTTGVISGIPTALSSATDYTIVGSNAAGSTQVALKITVKDMAPSNLNYLSNNNYTKGQPIPVNSPTSSGGAIVSYAVTPALPAGLTLNVKTGVISGTPTAVSALATYTITGTNTGGSTSKAISIAVQGPPAVAYSVNPASYTVGVPIAANVPTSSGGAVTSFGLGQGIGSGSDQLPAGLSLNTATGAITGKPTQVTPAFSYRIDASNSVGTTSTLVSITVKEMSAPKLAPANTVSLDWQRTVNVPAVQNTGGPATSCVVKTALPEGLSLTNDCNLIGIPTSVVPVSQYTIVATNSLGSSSMTLSLSVGCSGGMPQGSRCVRKVMDFAVSFTGVNLGVIDDSNHLSVCLKSASSSTCKWYVLNEQFISGRGNVVMLPSGATSLKAVSYCMSNPFEYCALDDNGLIYDLVYNSSSGNNTWVPWAMFSNATTSPSGAKIIDFIGEQSDLIALTADSKIWKVVNGTWDSTTYGTSAQVMPSGASSLKKLSLSDSGLCQGYYPTTGMRVRVCAVDNLNRIWALQTNSSGVPSWVSITSTLPSGSSQIIGAGSSVASDGVSSLCIVDDMSRVMCWRNSTWLYDRSITNAGLPPAYQ